jgi:acetyl-CoA/propionyl-CoA carboxylase biotin carboxyl carrier protein
VTAISFPAGPGVRVDAGVRTGSVVGGQFDSLLAKLIVTGSDRAQALERSRRALAEFQVEGMATVLPFHRLVVDDPAFAASAVDGFTVHTRWIETEWDNTVPPFTADTEAEADAEPEPRQRVVVEVGGRRLEVSLPGNLALGGAPGAGAGAGKAPRRRGGGKGGAAASGDAVTAPMQGTIIKVAVSDGDQVAAGDLIVVLEAMKMENPVTAHRDGTVTGLAATAGSPVSQGTVLCEIKD